MCRAECSCGSSCPQRQSSLPRGVHLLRARQDQVDKTIKFQGGVYGANTSFFSVSVEPGSGPGLHVHPYAEVWIVRRGQAAFQAGGQDIVAGPGDILVVATGHAAIAHHDAGIGNVGGPGAWRPSGHPAQELHAGRLGPGEGHVLPGAGDLPDNDAPVRGDAVGHAAGIAAGPKVEHAAGLGPAECLDMGAAAAVLNNVIANHGGGIARNAPTIDTRPRQCRHARIGVPAKRDLRQVIAARRAHHHAAIGRDVIGVADVVPPSRISQPPQAGIANLLRNGGQGAAKRCRSHGEGDTGAQRARQRPADRGARRADRAAGVDSLCGGRHAEASSNGMGMSKACASSHSRLVFASYLLGAARFRMARTGHVGLIIWSPQ